MAYLRVGVPVMASKEAWLERIEDLFAELESDTELRDADTLEVLDEIVTQGRAARDAKREEIDRGGSGR